MSVWRREVLEQIGGYPVTRSRGEDQDFNSALARAGISQQGEVLPPGEIFYVHRSAISPVHLSSGGGGTAAMQQQYNQIGTKRIATGLFEIQPHWRADYVQIARKAATMARATPAMAS